MRASATPRLDRTMELADGRSLAYSEWGDLEGRPIVLHHGTPGSRLLCPDIDATESAGVRLITFDRSGYGRSDPRPDRTLLNSVDDFVELADRLGLPPCPVVGWSGGGPYALACAYRLPERVTSVGLAASPGLLDETTGARADFSAEGWADVELLRRDPVAGMAAMRERGRWYDGDGWETLFTESWGDADDGVLARPDVLEALQLSMREGARQGSTGYAQDSIPEAWPDSFTVADIRQSTYIWIGEVDPIIHGAQGEYLRATIPRATLDSYPGEAHLFPVSHWAEMLGALR